jgi:hypothetical protein
MMTPLRFSVVVYATVRFAGMMIVSPFCGFLLRSQVAAVAQLPLLTAVITDPANAVAAAVRAIKSVKRGFIR